MKKFLIIITLIFLNANLGQAETSIPDCECNKIKKNININKKAELQPQINKSPNYETTNQKEIKEQTQKTKKSWWRFW